MEPFLFSSIPMKILPPFEFAKAEIVSRISFLSEGDFLNSVVWDSFSVGGLVGDILIDGEAPQMGCLFLFKFN